MSEIIRITQGIYLSEEELIRIQKKYKFSSADIALLKGINITIENIIKPRISYSIAADDFVSQIFKDDYCIEDYCNENKYAVACVSLGNTIDELSAVYIKAKEVMIPTIIDDICMEVMAKAYSVMAGDISARYGFWTKNYLFPGDGIPVWSIKSILEYLNEEQVTCSNSYVMSPDKSVVMAARLTDTKCKNGHIKICDSCSNIDCEYREV